MTYEIYDLEAECRYINVLYPTQSIADRERELLLAGFGQFHSWRLRLVVRPSKDAKTHGKVKDAMLFDPKNTRPKKRKKKSRMKQLLKLIGKA